MRRTSLYKARGGRLYTQTISIRHHSTISFTMERNMAKETTHRDPERRAARIERRARKRAETVMRRQAMKARKNRVLEEA